MNINNLKKILIISAHFPPSNLAAVHRSRLFANHLKEFGWNPVILTVDEAYYEESLDFDLLELIPKELIIERASAFHLTKPRLIGDIGLRAFVQLYKKAKKLIKTNKIDFLFIPIPSFYLALLGRMLNLATAIPYGIDYIDPWVHKFPGSKKMFSRHWFSTVIASILEPIAVKNASIITGVAEGYYKGVIERNPNLLDSCIFGAMPYGGEAADHDKIKSICKKPYLFQKEQNILNLVYAGAMLPKAYELLEIVFQAIDRNRGIFGHIKIHFIGTGKTPNNPNGYNIKPLAQRYSLWESTVWEYPERIPYLDVLIHLNAADGVFVLGSTEPHYTPSKIFQAVLSKKPIFAILHKYSAALEVINQTKTGITCPIDPAQLENVGVNFIRQIKVYLEFLQNFSPENVKMEQFYPYSAKSVTESLVKLLDQVVK